MNLEATEWVRNSRVRHIDRTEDVGMSCSEILHSDEFCTL